MWIFQTDPLPIVGSGEEEAAQLLANPRNWRVHPKAQQKALEGVLDAVGWVQNVIVILERMSAMGLTPELAQNAVPA